MKQRNFHEKMGDWRKPKASIEWVMRTLLFLIVIVAAAYILFMRPKATPTTDTTARPLQSQSAQSAPGAQEASGQSDYLKRSLDRTHEALEANRKRVSEQP